MFLWFLDVLVERQRGHAFLVFVNWRFFLALYVLAFEIVIGKFDVSDDFLDRSHFFALGECGLFAVSLFEFLGD